MTKFRVILCFLVFLLGLFVINGIFFAIFVFMKVIKLMIIAAIGTFIYYLLTKEDKKDNGEGL